MINIEKEFFYAEIRDGFFVNERMKHVWAAQMKALDMFDRQG